MGQQRGHLFGIDAVGRSNYSVQTFVDDGKDTAFYIDALADKILNLFDSLVVQFLEGVEDTWQCRLRKGREKKTQKLHLI